MEDKRYVKLAYMVGCRGSKRMGDIRVKAIIVMNDDSESELVWVWVWVTMNIVDTWGLGYQTVDCRADGVEKTEV